MKRILLIAGVILTAVPPSAWTQTAAVGSWAAPRTPDGHPDLQGLWTTQTFTPLQRPERFAGREFLTDQEMLELTKLVSQEGVDPRVSIAEPHRRLLTSSIATFLGARANAAATAARSPRVQRKQISSSISGSGS